MYNLLHIIYGKRLIRHGLFIVTVISTALPAEQGYADYTVTLQPTLPERIVFSLDLPAGHEKLLETRSQPAEARNPRCGSDYLKSNAAGQWIAPASCQRVEWEINFKPYPDRNIGSFLGRHSVAFPHWWSIMEQTALLRPAGDKKSSEITIRQSGHKNIKSYVPSTGDASDFYVLGDTQETTQIIDGTHIRYVSDDLKTARQRGMLEMHSEAYHFLHGLFADISAVPHAKELLVIIAGNSKPDGINGSGAARSLVFDYPHDTNQRDAFLLMTVAHEQFHQLRVLYSESKGHSFLTSTQHYMWIEEGLAEYYGLKTVAHSQWPEEEKTKVRNTFIDTTRPVDTGLKELNRKFRQGDQSVYPLFYTQGATFFSEIDRLLQEKSHGKISLDTYAARLSGTATGDLNPEIVAQWHETVGTGIDTLITRYVGNGGNGGN
jgi:hypothetical protein